jgi:hypothetical protein
MLEGEFKLARGTIFKLGHSLESVAGVSMLPYLRNWIFWVQDAPGVWPKEHPEGKFVQMAKMQSAKFEIEKFNGKNNFELWKVKMQDLLVQ